MAEGQRRVCARHTAFDLVQNPHTRVDGEIGKTVFNAASGFPAVLQTAHGQQRSYCVNRQQHQQHPQGDDCRTARQQPEQAQQQRVAPFQRDGA